jgi:hypothetical protein
MALEMSFCTISLDELRALQADPASLEEVLETKEFASGPNHRNLEMFHYILTGSKGDAAPGIANIFADKRAGDAVDLGDNVVAVAPDALPKLKAVLAAVDEATVNRRWLELDAANDPDEAYDFIEVLQDLTAFCDEAIASKQTVLWTWG